MLVVDVLVVVELVVDVLMVVELAVDVLVVDELGELFVEPQSMVSTFALET